MTDYLGTPVQAYDESGKLKWEAELDIYGKVRTFGGDKALIPFRYQGQYEDEETGLYYNRFRYYDPSIGAYLSQDPIGLDGGMKLYAYVKNTVKLIDPLGLEGSGTTGGIPNTPGTVRRFMSKEEYKQFKKNGFKFDPTDSRGGISTTSTKVNPKNPDALKRSTGALGADYYVDINTSGKQVELKGKTKGGLPDWKIKDDVSIDDIVGSGKVCKS